MGSSRMRIDLQVPNLLSTKLTFMNCPILIPATWGLGLFQKLDAHPLKISESQKFYPHFSLGILKKLCTVFVARVKKTLEFPKFLIIFSRKSVNSHFFFTVFDIKIGNSHFFYNFRIPIFFFFF